MAGISKKKMEEAKTIRRREIFESHVFKATPPIDALDLCKSEIKLKKEGVKDEIHQ